MSWIQTYTGVKFDLLAPTPDMIRIEDIAHALANLCRFNGHVRLFYSVAQHSVHVSKLVPPQFARIALLHDATEAYVGDVVRPLKALLPDYKHIESGVWRAIAAHFNLPAEIPFAVKHADNIALLTERRDLLGTSPDEWGEGLEAVPPDRHPVIPRFPSAAYHLFMARYESLSARAVA